MTSIAKQARKDAVEYARAKMFYGEGAGVRRRLITETVTAKGAKSPEYARAFHRELARQDMAEHAAKARQERSRKDVGRAFSTNSRGLMTGNYTTVNTSVLIIATAAWLLHKNGLDAKAVEFGKKKVAEIREKRAAKKKVVPATPLISEGATIHPHPTAHRAG